MSQIIASHTDLNTAPVGTIVRSVRGQLGEVKNDGGHNHVEFVGSALHLRWIELDRLGYSPLSVVLLPSEEASLTLEVSILTPGGARHETHPATHDLVELTLDSAEAYVARHNARERGTAVVQTRRTSAWQTVQ